MRQVQVSQPGGPEVLKIAEAPVPTPGEGEVLIKVQAAGVNRADISQRQGRYALRPGMPSILGLEVAGTIAGLGPGVTRWKEGDDICALLTGGGYAEYVVTPAPQCLPVPKGVSVIEAASLPETFFTVWLDVFDLCHLRSGESLLVHGGSSGIGITAIQLAHTLGSRVFVTAGSQAKCEACTALGAEAAIDYRSTDFEEAIQNLTTGRGVDVILDMVGGSYTIKNIRSLAPLGRLVFINFMESSRGEIDIALVMGRQLTITGSGLRPQTVERKGQIAEKLEKIAWPLIEGAKIKPVIDTVYTLEQVAEAHRRMESSAHIGKILLRM
ncbi:MAG: NAD(P)H-quinone oxidoreductase [Bryobacterales bacterium]|nr:NAD(P)H-quinone oxidoreductase [Bryobacterales bacterium]MBV9398087.1 NAD(P)H-quinone oxidoreductase [Bryobacterales bacterium]